MEHARNCFQLAMSAMKVSSWNRSNSYSTLQKTNVRVPVADFTEEQLQRIKKLDEGYVSVAQYKKILKQVETPEELHSISQGYNWDNGFSLLIEMVQHNMCDGGTALEIYWRGQPDYYAGHKYKKYVPNLDVKGFSFLKKIEKIYLANNFTSNEIKYDPSDSYNDSLWQCLVKYADVHDHMLIANYGDRNENQNTLEVIRKRPDDLEDPKTLNFLATNYYKNKKQYWDMLDCARRLFSLDNELYRASYTRAMKHVEQALKNEGISTDEKFTESEIQKFYLDYIQLKENDVVALEKEIDGLEKSSEEVPRIKHINFDNYNNELAKLYVNVKNYTAAIAIHRKLLDQCRSGKSPEVSEMGCLVSLSNIYQEMGNFDSATECVDQILDGEDELGPLFFHRYKLLNSMDKSEQAESLLDKRLERLESDKGAAEKNGNPNRIRGAYGSIAFALERYRKDFDGAAAAFQQILDNNLYRNSIDRKELIDAIELLKQSKPSQIR